MKSKIFWPATTDFLLKFSSPILEDGVQMSWHYQMSWLPTNNKSSKHDSMIAEFCKNFFKKTCLNNFRIRILGNKKVLEKSQIGWRQMLLPSLPSRNTFLVIAVKFTHCRCRIVDVCYSWEELVTMGASFKTVIISVACEKGDYI